MKEQQLIDLLRKIRKDDKKSLQSVANTIGTMSMQTVHQVETGRVKLTVDTLHTLAGALGYVVNIELVKKQ